MSYAQLTVLIEALGILCNLVGKSFGVIKTTINAIEINISIPRRENKIGHKGYEIELDEMHLGKETK